MDQRVIGDGYTKIYASNIGIGTANPTTALQVEGVVKLMGISATGQNIDVNAKTLSNVSSLIATTVQQDVITSSGTNINVSGKTLSNVTINGSSMLMQTITASTSVSTSTITAAGQNIDVSGKTLSNVVVASSVLSTPSITAAGPNIDFNAKTLSNVATLLAPTAVHDVITTSAATSIIGFDGKTLSNIGAIVATSISGSISGNASTATKLASARTIALSGDVAGSVSFDGTSDVTITATIQADSIALGTDTTGNYVSAISAGTGMTVSGSGSEGASVTVTNAGVTAFNSRTGGVTLSSSDVTTALSYTPVNKAGDTVDGNFFVTGTLSASNLSVLGSTAIINGYETNTSNVVIDNLAGFGPALKVTQTGVGSSYPVADFYDNDVSTTVPLLRLADGGNVGINTASPQAKLDVRGAVFMGKGLSGAADALSGGPYFKQSNWDAAASSHTISSSSFCIGNNSAGTIHIQVSNKDQKMGNLQLSFIKNATIGLSLFEIASHKTSSLSTMTPTSQNDDIVLTTDADCGVCWTCIGGF